MRTPYAPGAPQSALLACTADEMPASDRDDSLALRFLFGQPLLPAPGQIALGQRAGGERTTAQIAAAFPMPEATMAQRISRAKQIIKTAGATLALPADSDGAERRGAVRHVLYLIFTVGYTSTGGTDLTAPELAAKAIQLTRLLHRLAPENTETAGLLPGRC
ncbi:RNA polymerase sigma factor OS=Streptomyces tendae OX=1932 GN=GUR47_16955 PE=3 SV=1 [Streptomyces tendae]